MKFGIPQGRSTRAAQVSPVAIFAASGSSGA